MVAAALVILPWPRLWGCSCAGGSTPCGAAGSAAAAFTGTVLNVADPPATIITPGTGPAGARRMAANRWADNSAPPVRSLRTIRIRISEIFSGVEPGLQEIKILTSTVQVIEFPREVPALGCQAQAKRVHEREPRQSPVKTQELL
jgi:hypothetical protein